MDSSVGDCVNVAAGFVVNTTRELKPGESHSGRSDTAPSVGHPQGRSEQIWPSACHSYLGKGGEAADADAHIAQPPRHDVVT